VGGRWALASGIPASEVTDCDHLKEDREMAKQKAKGNKQVVESKLRGLHGFDDKAVSLLIIEAAEQAATAKDASEAKAKAALRVCQIASGLRLDDSENSKLTSDDWASQWRYSLRGILPRLHKAKIEWVEQTERKLKDGSTVVGYKLTGYGRNISSDANRTGQYGIDARKCDSLMEVRKAIEAAKQQESEAAESEVERTCRELAGVFDDGIKALRKLLVEAESPEAWQSAIDMLAEQVELNAIPEIEAEAEAA
jgi:hypothetical protein